MGATVNYDGTTETIIATKGQTRIRLQTFATHGFRDEEAIPLDVPAKVIQGRTMVPLRFISESLGAGVDWDANSRMVKIKLDTARQKIQYENEDHPVWENEQSVINGEQTKASKHAGDIPLVTLAEKDIGQITQRWQQDNYFNYHEIIDLNNSFISPTLSETLGFIKWGDTAMERFERLLSYFSADVKDSSGWKEFISLEVKRDPVFSVLWATSTRDHISATLFGDLFPGFEVVPAIMDVEIKKQPDSEQWLFTKIEKVRAYETLEELK
ncbi:MAG: copper amine oxidase N-terminal domain-containing protein, partial [Desulfotomaculaceae bacterium]